MSNDFYTIEWRVLAVFVATLIYLMPWLVAVCRRMHRSWLLLPVTLVVGWTVIGWVACLVWASCARTVVDQAYLRCDTGWQPDERQSLFRPPSETTGDRPDNSN